MPYARIKPAQGGVEFYSSYDSGLVAGVKQLPYQSRRWNPDKKCWIISRQYIDKLDDLCRDYLGIPLDIQGDYHNTAIMPEQKLFRVEYIGQLKDRGNGELSAYGATVTNQKGWKYTFSSNPVKDIKVENTFDVDWSILFSESVLREWFEGENQKQSLVQSTYYSILAIKQNVSGSEIKRAWRKQVKRYHPDINKDDDAADMTRKINEAYEILSNPQKRNRYDAGLKLEASLNQPRQNAFTNLDYWKPPIRCGYILCEGQYEVGRFVVNKILQWQDIVENGQTLVTSWDTSTSSLVRSWI